MVPRLVMMITLLAACGCSTGLGTSPDNAILGTSNDPAVGTLTSSDRRKPRTTRTIEVVRTTREPWSWLHYEGLIISSPNFRIYTTIDDEQLLKRLPLFYEQALAFYTSTFGDLPLPDKPLTSYVLQDIRQWKAKTQQLLPKQAATYATLGRGGLTTRGVAVLYFIDWKWRDRDTLAIAAHEGWHQYSQTTFRQHLPVWLEEGLATYVEGYRNRHDPNNRRNLLVTFDPVNNSERLDALRRAYRNDDLIPLTELLDATPQSFLETSKTDLLTYYAQVWSLTRFLAEGDNGRYRPALEDVITDAAEGRLTRRLMNSNVVRIDKRRAAVAANRLGTWVAREYFNADLNDLDAGYQAYIRRLVSAQSMPR